MDWRLIVDAVPRCGAENMAFDQALLEGVQAGGRPVLRLYRWAPACLSLGRNQPTPGRSLANSAAARGIDVVRRPTGGGAVYHDRELTYAVAVPVGALGTPRESYHAVHRALAVGLRRLGVAAEPAAVGGPGPRGGSPVGTCFRAAAPGEVVVGGRKLVGSAQRCERRTLLQHGSILVEDGQRVVAELLGEAAPRAETGATSLATLLNGVPSWPELVAAVVAGFEMAAGIAFARAGASRAELRRIRDLTAHFRSAAWTWRR
ncbi:MAG TPA: lipoate--protein ligase family protein [Longimicrobiales bacterium]